MAEERKYVAGTYAEEAHIGWRRLSWGAIFAGVFVTLAVFVTLHILGAGIGAATIDLTGKDTSSGKALGIGAAIWWLLAGLISLFVGGWTAGWLASMPNKPDRALHGLVVWAVFYMIMFWLVTTALGALAGGAISAIGKGVSAAGEAVGGSEQIQQTLKQTAQQYGITPEMLKEEVTEALGPNTPQQNQQQRDNVSSAVKEYMESQKTPQDRQKLSQTLTQQTGKSQQEVDQMITNMEQKAQQAQQKLQQGKEQAKEVGEQAATVTGATFIGLAFTMVLGAVAAMLGGLAARGPYYVVRDDRPHEGRRRD